MHKHSLKKWDYKGTYMKIKNILLSIFVLGATALPSTATAGGMSSQEAGQVIKFFLYVSIAGSSAIAGGTVGAVAGGINGYYKAYALALDHMDTESSKIAIRVATLLGAATGAAAGGTAGCVTGMLIGAAIVEAVCD